jgi:translocation and assembly module TamB
MDELGGEISADAEAQLKDLNFIRKRVPWMRRFDGVTQVKLHVSGPAAAPSLKGSFFLKDGEVSHTLNFPMLSEVNLQGEFDEASITITSMKAEVGGSPVNLSGSVNREGETVAVNLHADGRNLLLFRNNDMRLRGDVQLQVSGPWEHLLITGTTGLTGGYYNKNIDFLGKIGVPTAPVSRGGTFLFSFGEEPLKNAVLDIRITTIEPFRIRNNLIRGTLRPELTLKGTGEVPFLVGTIYIDPSRVLLPSGRLQVQSGLVRFLEKNPDRPLLNLLATSKVLDYDINIVIQGPIDDPVITLSSSPALPNDDLLLLLLTGQPPQEGNAVSDGMGRSATNVMVYLGRDFLSKWLEDESAASDETILDRFELDYGRGVTKSGEQTIESTFRLSEKATGPKRVYYLSGEKDRYDAYNYGFKVVFRFE